MTHPFRTRTRRPLVSLGAVVLAVGLAAAGPLAGSASAGEDPGTPLPVATPVSPVIGIGIADVRVTASTPRISFSRSTSAGLFIPVAWKPTPALPAGMHVQYDVEYRHGHAESGLFWDAPWAAWQTNVTQTSTTMSLATANREIETGDWFEFRVRAVDPVTLETGPWSASVISTVPMDDNWHHQTWISPDSDFGDITFHAPWSTLHNSGDYFGADHTTTKKAEVLGSIFTLYGRTLSIYGTKCPACGRFTVSMQVGHLGNHYRGPVTVDTRAGSTQHRVLLYRTSIPYQEIHDFDLITQATPGRPRVSIDAYAVEP